MFDVILQDNETILWENKVVLAPYILNKFMRYLPVLIFLSCFFSAFVSGPICAIYDAGSTEQIFQLIARIAVALFLVMTISLIVSSYFEATHTAFVITNIRIIQRSGVFKYSFRHYLLKNVGNVEVAGELFDTNQSAKLIISTKDFHNNTHTTKQISIHSLNNAYDAYRFLSQLIEGSNDTYRIEIEEK